MAIDIFEDLFVLELANNHWGKLERGLKIIDDFAAGKEPKPGTYVKRQTSAPEGPPTSLTDETLFDGSRAKPLAAIPNAPKPPEPAAT